MYYPDLSPYQYLREPRVFEWRRLRWGRLPLNVGWLSRSNTFPTGSVPTEALDVLFAACRNPVRRTRGYQECVFCVNSKKPIRATRDGVTIALGDAEVRIRGVKGTTFAAPTLVYHYITDHSYLPPAAFIEALLAREGQNLSRL